MKPSNSSSPVSSFSSSPKSTPAIHTYSDPLNELIQQVAKSESRREKLENALASVQCVFKNKQHAIRQVLQSKQVAIEMARHLKSRYESLRASNDSRGKALVHAQKAQTELISRFEQTESAKRELENQLIKLEEQLAESAMANAHLQQQIPLLTNQISQLSKEVATNADAMTALSEVESRLIRYRDSAAQSALAVEAIQLRCQNLNEQLMQKNILQQDKVEIEKQLVNLQKTTANQEKEIQDLLFIKRSNEIQLLESEQQVLKAESESKQLRKKNYELEKKLSNVGNTISALDDIRKELAEQAARHETERHELSSLLKVYQQETNEARAEAQTVKDNIRIKDKIITDQGDSILHLKQQVQEKLVQIQKLNDQKNLLEKQLVEANTRLIKAEMRIKQLEQQRKEMEEQFERLTHDLESHYKQELCPPEAYEKYKGQLLILEEQVRERQQEYLIRLKELTEERNKEATLAQQARNQLVDTIREFEGQMEIHRQAQSILKAALKSKDEELQMANAASSRLKLELQESRIYAQHNRAAIEEKLRMACNACSQLIDHLILGPGMVVAEMEDEETTFVDQS